ncbi:NAD(+) diphosphatase [Mycetocola miduiensis]|uniref:NAD(+) diphosphatase n=1 Tax=Mycetocola miduiensis TaxID=995034 RepID=UPI001FE5A91D|nr:NAD(+) diphosphatase [Mycetocola miduiensis]
MNRDADVRVRQELFAELAGEPDCRVLALWNGKTLMSGDALALFPADAAASAELLFYLGRTTEPGSNAAVNAPVLAAVLSDDEAAAIEPDPDRWVSLRESGDSLGDADSALMTAAVALANWHASSPHCPRCGATTEPELAGWARRCPACQNQIFPRTDPAVIVLVLDGDDRLLLGSNVLWPEGRYSLLAGFVEAGESLEHAVCREIAEEAGVKVEDPRYLGSQPWPFPRSMMLGFSAQVAAGRNPDDLQPDGEEIVDLRWFSREQLRKEAGTLLLPGQTSIARHLIDAWLVADGGGDLDESARAAASAIAPA